MYQLIFLVALLSSGCCFMELFRRNHDEHKGIHKREYDGMYGDNEHHHYGHRDNHDWHHHGHHSRDHGKNNNDSHHQGDDHDSWRHHGHDYGGCHHHGKNNNDSHHQGDDHDDWRHHGHDEDWGRYYEHKLNKLSSYVMKADRFANHFCEFHGNSEVHEQYGDTTYKVTYTVPSTHVNNITVKINYRVLYIYAEPLGDDKSQKFVHMRILPNIMNTSDAWWQYKENRITVNIPYNMPLRAEREIKCANLTDNVVTVSNVPAFDYRFSVNNKVQMT